ncbi:MAG TPA: FtsQ-type POTRA domain-containing protein, partial [Myxococcales bacterium]|nr:FtsQ-type POTRA domain-containing protein [Myxococcales bacterium]
MSLFGVRKNRRRPDREERISALRRVGIGLGRFFLALGLLAAGLGGTWAGGRAALRWVTTSPTFAIGTLSVEGNHRVSADAVRAASGLAVGQNVFRADLEGAKRELEKIPWIRHAQLTRVLPRTVAIRVEERQPVAQVALGTLYLVDEEGELFKRASPADGVDLPVITGLSRDRFESDRAAMAPELGQALELLAEVSRRKLPELSEIHLDDDLGLTAYLADGATAIELGWGDL